MKKTIFKNKSIKSFLDFFFKIINFSNIYLRNTRQNKWFWENSWIYFFKRYSWTNFNYPSSGSHYMSYLGFWIFYIWRKSKNRFNLFINIYYSNNNNFSCIPFSSKSSIVQSRIDRWINYYCNKGTIINNLIKETLNFSIFSLLILGSDSLYELIHKPLYYHIFD